jgi:endonuclease/exonuclease/phosphatase family metal-dependent hydrolase
MSVKVMGWNLEEGLALEEQSPRIVEAVIAADADVVCLSDAYWLHNPARDANGVIAEAAKQRLRSEGYELLEVEYKDAHQTHHEHYLLGLSRLPVHQSTIVRLGSRNGLHVSVEDPDQRVPVQLFGLHFDDGSESSRARQVADLLECVDEDQPTALIGDFNAMHGEDLRSRVLRWRISERLIHKVPHAHLRSLGTRLIEMASGYTLQQLEAAGFRDVDDKHRLTIPSRFPVWDLDHCFVNQHLAGRDFRAKAHGGVSDHRAIETELLV